VTESLTAGAPAAVTLTRERPGRYWMVAPASDRGGARRLAERIVTALADWRSSAGMPLSVVVGAASCPEDGREAAALAAYADVDLYAARSAARSAARAIP
jgi:GGDEF domain-containing protein